MLRRELNAVRKGGLPSFSGGGGGGPSPTSRHLPFNGPIPPISTQFPHLQSGHAQQQNGTQLPPLTSTVNSIINQNGHGRHDGPSSQLAALTSS